MRILCLGDNVIDYYINTGAAYPGGNAVNVAVHSAKLGADAAYLGNFGDDQMAAVIQRALAKFRVDTKACATLRGASTKCCNYEVIAGERRFCGVDLGPNWAGPMVLTDRELAYMEGFDVVCSSCNAKLETELHKLAALSGLMVFDFGEKEKYRTAEYLGNVCGFLDLALFSCPALTRPEAQAYCRRIHQAGAKHVLITMGAAGQYVSNGELLIHGKAEYIEPLDTMGAGDSFLAAFISSLYGAGWKKHRIMEQQALAAALAAGMMYSTENCRVEGGFGYQEQL